MWEKIKNAFKWVADHTGISWIARKISSGWKWLFGGGENKQNIPPSSSDGKGKENDVNGPGQGNDKSRNTTPKTPGKGNGFAMPPIPTNNATNQPTPTVIPAATNQQTIDPQSAEQLNGQLQGGLTNGEITPNHLKIIDNSLNLVLTEKAFEKCKTYENPHNENEILVYITCNGSEYRITGVPSNNENKVNVNSVAKVENGEVNDKTIVSPTDNMAGVKELLNVNDFVGEASMRVTRLSNEPSKKNKTVVLPNNKVGKESITSGNLSDPTAFQGNPPTSETLLKQVENGKKLFYAPQLSEFLRKEAKKDLGRIITFDKVVPSSLFTNTKTENTVDSRQP